MYEIYLISEDIDYLKMALISQEYNPREEKQIERILHALEMASIPAKHEEVECKQRTGAE
jgi:hypothetical protein